MLDSPSFNIRKIVIAKIIKLKQKPPKAPRSGVLRGIRSLKVPKLQWNAFSWVDIIDWNETSVHLPYIIECLSEEEISACMWRPPCFPAFPLHTQSVERAVKLVTEASHQVQGEESRHGYILSVLEARRVRKPFETKKDYMGTENK